MYSDRIKLYKKLEKQFKSKLIVYVTGDRRGAETQISSDVIDYFIGHLEKIGVVPKLSLFLYTRGGEISAAWNIVNLLKMYCDTLQVIIPHKAHSAGTIISIGANEIVMTKQATLGPIDPSWNSPLNPTVPNAMNGQGTYPVSVEAVEGYMDFAKNHGIKTPQALAQVFVKLSDVVHPLVLGQAYRLRSQIRMLAEKLLKEQLPKEADRDKVISFLCSNSGSHDYTINRREAEKDLNLKVIKPTAAQYETIMNVYTDIREELSLLQPFNWANENGAFFVRRCLLESVEGGCDYFVTQGETTVQTGNGQEQRGSIIQFEGWRHDEGPEGLALNTGSGEVCYETEEVKDE